jgi:Fur family zinc uptake transcriptional regulator
MQGFLMAECEHDHDGPEGLSGHHLTHALHDAEDRCVRAGERMTQPRRRALQLLLEAGKPMKAYDLIEIFGEDGRPAKPPTVYRALDFLAKRGLAHRIESLNAYVACEMGEQNHAAAFLICDCCGATEEVEPFAPDKVQAAASKSGYTIEAVTVEAHGRCSACAA